MLLQRGGKTAYFGETGEASEKVLSYFARGGAPCPNNVNPAEHIVDVVQGRILNGVDWSEEWKKSAEATAIEREQAALKEQCLAAPPTTVSDGLEFASSLKEQLKIVTYRHFIALWRKPDYIWNKIILHIVSSLFAGFTFWKIGTTQYDLQLRLFAVFNILFVAIGCINQLQPLFIANRDIFEAREKKSKTYGWVAFVTAQMVAEFPALIICGTLYFVRLTDCVRIPVYHN